MAGANFLGKMKTFFKKEPTEWDLSDTASFDFSHDRTEDDDEDTPTFKKLKVVISGEPDCPAGPHTNGSLVNTVVDDDESLLDSSSLGSGPGVILDPCANCTKRKEKGKRSRVMKKLGCAALLYFLFMIGELIGGYVANSLAIMTDALHMLTDLVGIVVSLLALWLSSKPPTKRFTFGLHRLEVVSAAISVLLIYILTAVLLNEAVQRTIHQDFDIDGDVMLITAAVGVAVNLIMGFLLNQSGHVHSHAHHQASGQTAHSHGSLAVRAAFVHALGDLVQSVGVLVAAYVVRFKPEYKIADPICTYIFSVLVLFTTVKIVRDTGIIVLEGVPRHLDVTRIREDLLKLEEVHSVEDLNVWALAPDKTAALVHLSLVPSSSSDWEEVQAKARHLLASTYGISKSTIQLQRYRETSPVTCVSCQLT
ncbi:probable proton-coupled zinc antiporter SLC30A4 [Paramormyrops kingsleyae]|uniref:Probable proton-coupled zinc antiporter SLC30A4 n=1 Tax=Paramormyrops kingsleyae TaxID=1676925 RepID=A0A3B3Q831_9TELE|nr:zinc transporter 4 [Paramormyrops kingsleyae]XP_023669646.1 zinc transporter 4 [Paramormyrops kingsleyae]XP_023669647.1 zinc transporter 4 [Paramormyrops kingsleyae]